MSEFCILFNICTAASSYVFVDASKFFRYFRVIDPLNNHPNLDFIIFQRDDTIFVSLVLLDCIDFNKACRVLSISGLNRPRKGFLLIKFSCRFFLFSYSFSRFFLFSDSCSNISNLFIFFCSRFFLFSDSCSNISNLFIFFCSKFSNLFIKIAMLFLGSCCCSCSPFSPPCLIEFNLFHNLSKLYCVF